MKFVYMKMLPCGINVPQDRCCADNCPYPKIRKDDLKSQFNAIEMCYKWHKNGQKGPDPVRFLRG